MFFILENLQETRWYKSSKILYEDNFSPQYELIKTTQESEPLKLTIDATDKFRIDNYGKIRIEIKIFEE